MSRTLHLIKHRKPVLNPQQAAHDWPLDHTALTELPTLAQKLQPKPSIIISSKEDKAIDTATALANLIQLEHHAMLGLHETLRYTAPFYPDVKDFNQAIAQLFNNPDQVVFGEESAHQAQTRFHTALSAVMASQAYDSIAVVSHGTVITLLLAQINQLDPITFWQSLKLLDVVTVEWPSLKIIEI